MVALQPHSADLCRLLQGRAEYPCACRHLAMALAPSLSVCLMPLPPPLLGLPPLVLVVVLLLRPLVLVLVRLLIPPLAPLVMLQPLPLLALPHRRLPPEF